MNNKLTTAVLLAAFSVVGVACSDNTPPPAQHAHVVQPSHDIPTIADKNADQNNANVNYVTGGIGDDERAAIEGSKSNYNVHVLSASTKGAFVEDTQIVIAKKDGTEVLNVNAGPLLYAQLAPGSYVLEATHADQTKKQNIVIGSKSKTANIHLSWKVPATTSEE